MTGHVTIAVFGPAAQIAFPDQFQNKYDEDANYKQQLQETILRHFFSSTKWPPQHTLVINGVHAQTMAWPKYADALPTKQHDHLPQVVIGRLNDSLFLSPGRGTRSAGSLADSLAANPGS